MNKANKCADYEVLLVESEKTTVYKGEYCNSGERIRNDERW